MVPQWVFWLGCILSFVAGVSCGWWLHAKRLKRYVRTRIDKAIKNVMDTAEKATRKLEEEVHRIVEEQDSNKGDER